MNKYSTLYARMQKEKKRSGDVEEESIVESKTYIKRLVYVNDILVCVDDITSLERFPIVPFCLFENDSFKIQDRYKAVYDLIKNEMFMLYELYSSLGTSLKNSTKNSIIYNSNSVPSNMEKGDIRNKLIPLEIQPGEDLSNQIMQLQGQAFPSGILESIMAFKGAIESKLNILSVNNSSNSAEQEALKTNNQVRLNLYLTSCINKSIYIATGVLKDMMMFALKHNPKSIFKRNDVGNDLNKMTSCVKSLHEAKIEIIDSHYYESSNEIELSNIERISSFIKDDVQIPLNALLKVAGISDGTIQEIERHNSEKQNLERQREAENHELQMMQLKLEMKKEEAKIAELQSRAHKNEAESLLKIQEIKENNTKNKEQK